MLAGMGTELQCSPNFFTTLPRNHGNTVTISFDTPNSTRPSPKDRPPKETSRTGPAPDPLLQPHPSMERIQCHKESLRKTMLEHEKIFKEQVRELHRLYRTQKLLMSQLQNREPKLLHPLAYPAPAATAPPGAGLRGRASGGPTPPSGSSSTSNRHGHGAQPKIDHSSHLGHRTKASLGSQELTISSREENPGAAQSDGFERQQPPAAGIPTARAQDHKLSTETPSSCSDEECDLDLTLSIGPGGGGKKSATRRRSHSENPSGCCPESSPANSAARRTTSSTPARSDPGGRADAAVGFDREGLQRPPWLVQGLTFNRT